VTGRYVEVRVSGLPALLSGGELLGFLDDSVLGAWEAEGRIHLYWPEAVFHPRILEQLQTTLDRLGGGRAEVESISEPDWIALWAESVRPVRIGRRFVVRQSWTSAPLGPGDIELVIDPRRAFGTGHHPTTQLLVELLEERIRGGERFLDTGTGSGILAMAALRLGARSATAIDADADAIACAREYAAENGFGPELVLRVARLEELPAAAFDVVTANLDRETLIRHAARLRAFLAPRGMLLVSGVLREDQSDLAAAFSAAGGAIREWRERDEWAAGEIAF
jgi:ribosomal protein L11 methyltransferase